MTFFQECMANDGRHDGETGSAFNHELCDKHPTGAEFYRAAFEAASNKAGRHESE